MIIHKVPIRNRLRNYLYLLVDERSKEALAIDPLAHKLCLDIAEEHGYHITQVLNTHHHHDHIGGNTKVIEATGATLLAHANADIPDVDQALNVGDVVNVGRYELQVMDTPGHTMSHICLFYAGDEGSDKEDAEPALFSGDTLFNAGVGHCYLGGHPETLFQTLTTAFVGLPSNTRLFPGHDYIENNLKFTLDREPKNRLAKELLMGFDAGVDSEAYVTTLKIEQAINVFMRLDSQDVRTKLNKEGQSCVDDKSTFLALRELRNQW